MPLFIHGFVEAYPVFSILLWRDAGPNAFADQAITEPVGIVSFIRKQETGGERVGEQGSRAVKVRNLPRREKQAHGAAKAVENRVELAV